MFHNEIINDHKAIAKEEAAYEPLPPIREVSEEEIMAAYNQVKSDIRELIKDELAKRIPPTKAKGKRKQQQKQEKRSLSL